MASKHDQHAQWIAERRASGASWAQIARDMAAQFGVKTSQDELSKWEKRRSAKVARNTARLVKAGLLPAEPEVDVVKSLAGALLAITTRTDLAPQHAREVDVHVKQSRKSKANKAELNPESTGNPVSASSTSKSTSLEIPPRSAFPPPSEPGRLAKDVVLPPIGSESIEAQSAPMGDFLSRLESSLTKKTTKKGL